MPSYKVYQKKANKKGCAPVYISFYLNRQKLEIPAKISVPVDCFDKNKGVVRNAFEFAEDYNLIISNIKAGINDVFVKYRLRDNILTPSLFWKEYKSRGIYTDFYSFCIQSQKIRFQELSEGTQKQHRNCINNLKLFRKELYFEDITVDFFRLYILHLRNKLKMAEITIDKNLRNLSIYLNEAVSKKLIKENPIHNIKKRGFNDNTVEALSEDEFIQLVYVYRKNTLPEDLHNILEFFLFMCYSSLHISDAKQLRIEQIGTDEFVYTRTKMMNRRPRMVRVPICDPLRKIIENQKRKRKEGVLWDTMISDQKINKKLKEIARLVGISINLSAKIGRHTFATIFLRKTRDINTLKEIMGHSNISQTLVYSHVLDQDRKEGIKVFNSF